MKKRLIDPEFKKRTVVTAEERYFRSFLAYSTEKLPSTVITTLF